MKKTNTFYWILTILLAVGMTFSAIPNVMSSPEAVAVFKQLGYPQYLLPFLGVAKLLGVVAILVPGFPRIREWAYAGFFFDLTGAFYSGLMTSGPDVALLCTFILAYALLFGSYFLYHKRGKAQA
ncbi:MAG TPA: DoxX family protein [Chitinophaga sp.]|uniref:DoxX family protein n=1 Tax=Chitinophaga sp. TaxID=1869181 RepID=UPI002BF97738|nr:DoxX family protein [Chitinophaga sp.]HVI47885.1 DoxX family protein [Chitinophaga sp.]